MEFKTIYRQLKQLKIQFSKQIDTGFSLWNHKRMEIWEEKKLLRQKINEKSCQDTTQDTETQLKTDNYMKKRNRSELISLVNPNLKSHSTKKEDSEVITTVSFTAS